MSRKHFKAIAEAIREIKDMDARKTAAEKMAVVCAEFNPHFSYSRFMEACGVSP